MLPQRLCLGCNRMLSKDSLLRTVKSKDGDIFVDVFDDSSGKSDGRGAYVCYSLECFNKARKAKRLERAFKCKVSDQIYDAILDIIMKSQADII